MNTPPPAPKPARSLPARTSGPNAMLLGTIGLAVGLVVGYGVGRVSTGTPINPLSDKKGGYDAGYEAAKVKLEEAGVIQPTTRAIEAKTLSGTVTAVADASFTFEAVVPKQNPLEEPDVPKLRTARVTSETRIYRRVSKPIEQFKAEVDAYQSAPPPSEGPPPSPPSPYMEEELTLKDLAAGDKVEVTAATDIYAAESFDAVTVLVTTP